MSRVRHGLSMKRVAVGLSLMLEEEYRAAAYPLLDAGEVDILEWSFDTCWGEAAVPEWAEGLIDFYSRKDRLLGHGVYFPLFAVDWKKPHRRWMMLLGRELKKHRYRRLSVHYGFMGAGSFVRSAPLPVPQTANSLQLGRKRLRRLAEVSKVPVGLENLAFAFGKAEVEGQGGFLDRLLEPVGGFLLLDLHNLYCQIRNFRESETALSAGYPLDRVREIHVSGGSWRKSIRRDTHDGPVPEEVFRLLVLALEKCPNADAVIFERLGDTLGTAAARRRFQSDYRRIRSIVKGAR